MSTRIAAMSLVLALPLAAQNAPSFAKDIAPIFAANCLGCHGAKVKMGGLNLDTFEGLQAGGSKGPVLAPANSGESRLYLMISGKMSPSMPLSGQALAAGDIEAIRGWIDAGAKPPTPEEARSLAASLARPVIPDIRPKAPVKAQIGALAYRPDGRLLALGSYQEVRLVDPVSRKVIATLSSHAEEVRAVAFSADGKYLAAAGGLPARGGEVKIWDVDQRTQTVTIRGHADCIYAVAFSPDGRSVATSSYDKLIKLWDAASGNEIHTLKDHIDAVYALVFTPDGQRIVSASADRAVKVWDAATGERLYSLSEPADGLNTVAIDPSGEKVAAGGLDKTIRIWTLGPKSGTLLNSLIAHEEAILQVAWSPDGKLLASSSADKTIKVFNAGDLTEIKTLASQPDWVMSLAFSPDGQKLAAGRYDGSLEIYNVSQFAAAPARQAHNTAP